MPVLVSKVSPQSPAEKSNPPLEEGDQLLYINSKPVSHSRHEEVISMIRASRDKTPMELILIVKPKDLSRTNPIVRTQTTESATSDPGQLLRQSLTYLKESLSNSMGLLQFDRLYRRKPGMAAIASKLPQNLVKNRYRDISAYDATRVHLREGPDYINANFVNLEVETTGQIVSYIASQGPMQHTCKDFWQMVWEQSCELVIMLTEVVENGKVRCCQYWPEKNSTKDYGKFQVMTLLEQVDRVYITRRFKLRNNLTGEEHTVTQMQYIDWPDHGMYKTHTNGSECKATHTKTRNGS
jgi:protein tyrosine phosphatase